jgi:hypothetical protein
MLLSTQLLLLFFLHAVDFPDVLDDTDVPVVVGVPANFGFPAVLLLLRFRLLLVSLLLCHPCSCFSVSPTWPHAELIGFGYFHLPTMLLQRLPNRRLVSTVARCLE